MTALFIRQPEHLSILNFCNPNPKLNSTRKCGNVSSARSCCKTNSSPGGGGCIEPNSCSECRLCYNLSRTIVWKPWRYGRANKWQDEADETKYFGNRRTTLNFLTISALSQYEECSINIIVAGLILSSPRWQQEVRTQGCGCPPLQPASFHLLHRSEPD
jgi:hypothetical protein